MQSLQDFKCAMHADDAVIFPACGLCVEMRANPNGRYVVIEPWARCENVANRIELRQMSFIEGKIKQRSGCSL